MENEEFEVIKPDTKALESITRAEFDIQITTAKRFPRNVKKSILDVRDMALRDDDSASKCYYVLPRKAKDGQKKDIVGPSVRLAEIVAKSYGNLRVGTRVMDIGERDVTVQAVCHDLETNLAVSVEVKRRITYKDGTRYNDDMIFMTANAASSIAYRNAVLRVVPSPIWESVFHEAMEPKKAVGKDISQNTTKALETFIKMGVSTEQILFRLGRKAVQDVTSQDIVELRGIYTAIQEGTATLDEVFGETNTVKQNIDLSMPIREPGED